MMTNLNWNKEFALEQAADDADLLRELLELFKASCANDLGLIKSGLARHDPEQIRAAAHSIKGAASSLGIQGIRDLALAIETEARTNRLHAIHDHYPELEALTKELQSL
ncbi:Hpt domain-containing protein [Desulfofustis limnaeus]|jgi:HPt (histidine-containing phosphotransfer) domain-containing protein|uniref:HPt domain-containing protein n=1 Tax=Desulfofustis limnaeus TaxID=2740163 RepID=A0ABN6M519_9BACT|nr:Hpt domain-containing protein [Desulfofustis limnaeus]MDX9894211.1 Hpt domain-containing protein [Desulfofustis sp.]BDD87295.1 hypothetical protein DPPLL_16600 [Desulfofustis limnaeus]